MNYINVKFRELALQLLKPRKYNYCQDALQSHMQKHQKLRCQRLLIKNKRNQQIDTIILKSIGSTTLTSCDTCIIYAHGLGSNKLEVLTMVDMLQKQDKQYNNYHICAFDFSGGGRSQGEYTTYGLRQQDDINAILAYLDSTRKYNKYILWGRSMGGASIILSQSRNLNKKVQCMILDSPFSSFQRAAIQLASRTTYIPQIMINLILEPIKNQLKKDYPTLNPFQLDICSAVSKIQAKIMLIYSKDDSIVNFNHSKQIGRHCQKNAVQIQIQEDHNKPRKKQMYCQVFKFIKQSMQQRQHKAKRSSSKGRGISVSSKQNMPSNYKAGRTSISSSINSQKNYTNNSKFDRRSQNIASIGSFVSCDSRQMYDKDKIKNATFIKSVLLQNSNKNNDSWKQCTRNYNSINNSRDKIEHRESLTCNNVNMNDNKYSLNNDANSNSLDNNRIINKIMSRKIVHNENIRKINNENRNNYIINSPNINANNNQNIVNNGIYSRDPIRNSIKYANNRYKNCVRLL